MSIVDNLVHENSETTGTGALTLTNVSGKQSFNDAFGTGGSDVFFYHISNRSAAEWEVGTGHMSAATTMVRDTVIASSNADTAVNFTAGTKDVTSFPDAASMYYAGGTDVPVTDGGTGRSTSTTAYGLLAAGTTATGAHQTLAAGATTEILVGGGASALPAWTTATGSGSPVRATSPTLVTPVLGTPSSGTLTNCTGLPATGLVPDTTTAVGFGSVELGHASDTTVARASAGNISVEGNIVYRAGGTDVPVADGGTGGSDAATARSNLAAAPNDAQYLALATSSGLSAERVFTAGDGVRVADAGANGAYTVSADSFLPVNVGLAVSAGASALTITLNGANGSTPSSTNPVLIPFSSQTATTGTPQWRSVTSSTTLVVSSGSTLGVTSSTAFRLWVVAFDDAGTVRLGVINCSTSSAIYPLNDSEIASSTAEGGAGGADSAGVFYTGTAVTSKPYRILGYIEWSTSGLTAGTWTTTNVNRVRLFGPGTKKPGDIIQTVVNQNSTGTSGSTTIPLDNTIPQNTEGFEVLSTSITPSSAVNHLVHDVSIWGSGPDGINVIGAMFQDSGANALVARAADRPERIEAPWELYILYEMRAGTASSTTFAVRVGPHTTGTLYVSRNAGGSLFNGTGYRTHRIVEIVG